MTLEYRLPRGLIVRQNDRGLAPRAAEHPMVQLMVVNEFGGELDTGVLAQLGTSIDEIIVVLREQSQHLHAMFLQEVLPENVDYRIITTTSAAGHVAVTMLLYHRDNA